MENFHGGKLPTPKTMLEMTASLVNPPLIQEALEKYKHEMDNVSYCSVQWLCLKAAILCRDISCTL